MIHRMQKSVNHDYSITWADKMHVNASLEMASSWFVIGFAQCTDNTNITKLTGFFSSLISPQFGSFVQKTRKKYAYTLNNSTFCDRIPKFLFCITLKYEAVDRIAAGDESIISCADFGVCLFSRFPCISSLHALKAFFLLAMLWDWMVMRWAFCYMWPYLVCT